VINFGHPFILSIFHSLFFIKRQSKDANNVFYQVSELSGTNIKLSKIMRVQQGVIELTTRNPIIFQHNITDMKSRQNQLRSAKFLRNLAIICVFVFSISLIPLHANDIVNNPDKNSQLIGSEQSLSKSISESESQLEEEMEVELWMLNPKHQSWYIYEESEIGLSRWMIDINSGDWMIETCEEAKPNLQTWMLLPKGWLQ